MATKFKMVGKDVDSFPTQYRTWLSNSIDINQNDFNKQKSGDNKFIEVSAHIFDDSFKADFNLPDLTIWKTVKKTLPANIDGGQLAIIDGYAYIFGGINSDKILRASILNPGTWEDTGYVLPDSLHGSQLLSYDGYLYLFGGRINTTATNKIYIAQSSNPLSWTYSGSNLPQNLYWSQLCVTDTNLYLYGGCGSDGYATGAIFSAPISNPLNWSTEINTLYEPVFGASLAINDGKIYLFGGITDDNTYLTNIYYANITTPTTWVLDGYSLPGYNAFAQPIVIGDTFYLLGGNKKKIYVSDLSAISQVVELEYELYFQATTSQVALINGYIYLYGGSGHNLIQVSDVFVKYTNDNPTAIYYDLIINDLLPLATEADRFSVIGFCPWKTDLL